MLSLNPQLDAYRAERSKQRNAARSPRFPGDASGMSSFGPSLDRRNMKAMQGLMEFGASASMGPGPTSTGITNDMNRLF